MEENIKEAEMEWNLCMSNYIAFETAIVRHKLATA